MTIYTPYITRNGRRVYASEYGLKVFCFDVSDEQHKRYLEKKKRQRTK